MRSICPAGPACAAALAQSDATTSQRGEECRGASLARGRHGESGRCKLTRAPAHVEAARPIRAHARSGSLGATTPSQGSSLEAGSSLVTFQRRFRRARFPFQVATLTVVAGRWSTRTSPRSSVPRASVGSKGDGLRPRWTEPRPLVTHASPSGKSRERRKKLGKEGYSLRNRTPMTSR